MTSPVSLLPPQSGWEMAVPTVNGLTDGEQQLMTGLALKLSLMTPIMLQRWAYYDGEQRLQNIGISIPPQLAGVRTVVDWPRNCVDPLVQRAEFAGFRLPTATDIDDELAEFWDANDMAGELPLAILDSLVAGRGFLVAGSPDVPGDAPLVTVESPLNMTGTWDARTRTMRNAYQAYEVEGQFRAALYLPDQTITMSREGMSGQWLIEDRDQHNLGEVLVVRLANRSRTSDREGRSQITHAVMNTTDSACRSLLGMEIAREVYSVPHLYILGAKESDWVDGDGHQKSGMSMAMTKVLALERDAEGELPKVGQFTAFDPSVFTKIIDKHGQLMSSYTGLPASHFGVTTTVNPSSADALRVSENSIDRAGLQVQRQSTPELRKIGQLMWRIAHNGADLPAELRRVQVDWVDPTTPQPAATTDAIYKQISAGVIPPRSDVTRARLGYSAVERQRLDLDMQADPGAAVLAELATSLEAKEARADKAIADDIIGSTGSAGAASAAPISPAQ